MASTASSPNYTPCPPPSRSGSTAEELYDLTMSCMTEYHATSTDTADTTDTTDTADTADTVDFDEKVLESDVFKWQELTTFASSNPPPVANSESDSDRTDSNCSEDYSDMPPLVSSDSDESNTEDNEEDLGQEQEIPTPAPREIPPLITFLGLMLFLLHLFYYIELLQERDERAKNPCFRMRF